MCIVSPKPPLRIGSEFNAHHERSHVASWMRLARLKKLHCALPSLQRCFKCPLSRFASLPSAFCLFVTACTHTLKSQFASNPLSIYLQRWIEPNAHSISRFMWTLTNRIECAFDPLCIVHVNAPLLLLARSVKHHLAVTNVSSHWFLFTQWSMIKDLMEC